MIDRTFYATLLLAPLLLAGSAEAANLLQVADTKSCTLDLGAANTVPGWTVADGSPALLCPAAVKAAAPDALEPGLIGSGPWGDSALERDVAIAEGTSGGFTLSGWLGGIGKADAALTLVFRDAAGKALGDPVRLEASGAPGKQPVLVARSIAGDVPVGARTAHVALRFAQVDGQKSVGYADLVSLTLANQPDAPASTPPAASVPSFDHVFLIMMENTDFADLVGDTANAPFINGLMQRGTFLARYNAVYHPSDENYLAIGNGDTLVRNGVYFPKIHADVHHLGDVIEAAGKSWKAYEQGMGTPCNTTTKFDKDYEPDDTPFVNYANIIDNPARCQAHLVDTKQLGADLASATTTPNFAWIAADDYFDGEDSGNGSPKSLRVQDKWLKETLEPIFASPAWKDQRSLLILTWDESNTVTNNHIVTLLMGSQGLVRENYVSAVAYDHYSTARTIEATLGLPSLTANDGYARPINDAFAK